MNYSNSQTFAFGARAAHRKSGKKTWFKIILAILFAMGSWQVGSSVYLLAKAQLAQYLIAGAWQQTLKDGQTHKPWSWADTYPVAQLNFPSIDETSYVLEGANGRNMAFGPARTIKSGMPGQSISTIISAHNDSHFSFLGQIKLNDRIEITTLEGLFTYQVNDIMVVDSSQQQISINQNDELILTTCYPFNALQTGGKLRYQITAKRF